MRVTEVVRVIASAELGYLAVASPDTDPAVFAYNLGALGIALGCIYWLLGRGDRREKEQAQEDAEERRLLREMLAAEQAAHNETRKALLESLRRRKDDYA